MKLLQKLWRIYYSLLLFTGMISLVLTPDGIAQGQAGPGAVHVLEIEGVINPPVANYLERALQTAADQEASLVVIVLDTPGGLESSMRLMIQEILASPVPVAVYVAPPGARAASAGLFILQAAHIAAMAPGTNTGSAHPVGLGGEETDDVMTAKVVNDAAATIRGLAVQKGRNPEWAEQAVRESVSITEAEALEINVIEVIAQNLDDLLAQVQGQTIQTVAGEVVLDVVGAPQYDASMTFAEEILHVISDPNIAFILLSVGSIGILAELYNPGAFFPGTIGVISLILAFFSLGNLPTNWAGVALVGLAVILFVGELVTEGTGFLGVGALIAFVLGGLMLFRPFTPESPVLPDVTVSPWLLGTMTAFMGGIVLLVMSQVVRVRSAPPQTGTEWYIGQSARVYTELNPRGLVWFEGQSWNAILRTGGPIQAGQRVKIVAVDGLTLVVEPMIEKAEIGSDL